MCDGHQASIVLKTVITASGILPTSFAIANLMRMEPYRARLLTAIRISLENVELRREEPPQEYRLCFTPIVQAHGSTLFIASLC